MISPNVCILFWRTILACEHLLMGLKKTVPILSCSWCTSLHDHIEIWRNTKMLGLGFFFLGMGPARVFLLLCGKEEWKTTTYLLFALSLYKRKQRIAYEYMDTCYSLHLTELARNTQTVNGRAALQIFNATLWFSQTYILKCFEQCVVYSSVLS